MFLQTPVSPFEWVNNYIHTLGWGVVISFIGWLWWKSIEFTKSTTQARAKGETAIQQINDLATNHFPHMQKDLGDLSKKTDTTNDHLAESQKSLSAIATGIAVLVDRGNR